jgi:hypothetical protein
MQIDMSSFPESTFEVSNFTEILSDVQTLIFDSGFGARPSAKKVSNVTRESLVSVLFVPISASNLFVIDGTRFNISYLSMSRDVAVSWRYKSPSQRTGLLQSEHRHHFIKM